MNTLVSGGSPDPNLTVKIGSGPKQRAEIGLFGGSYHAASYGTQELAGWHPGLKSADAEVLPARDKIVARSRSLMRDNGWAAGGIETRANAVVGTNLRLRARPNFAAMGQSAEWADEFATLAEALFSQWANSTRFLCDVERHHHFGGLVRLAYTHYAVDGEACAPLYMLERGGIFSTSVLVLDPDRLSNPDGKPDSERLRGGIELDAYGAAVRYHVRRAHAGDLEAGWLPAQWTPIDREDARGRPKFIHVFDKKRAHARRGLGRFTPIMARTKMLDRYDATELKAAIRNAAFGLYVSSEYASDSVAEAVAPAGTLGEVGSELGAYQAARMAYHEQADVRLENVSLAHLYPGEKIEAVEAGQPATHFVAFQGAMLRSIASSLGISYEQLSHDWSQINYSSARTLLNEIWRGLSADRHLFCQSFCTPIYAAWMEEAVARDLLPIPGGKAMFYVWRDALTRADWLGPGRGFIDPLKEAKAAETRMAIGISSQDDECAEQGKDADEVRWQRKRDTEKNKEYGLSSPEPAAMDPEADANPDAADTAERQTSRSAA